MEQEVLLAAVTAAIRRERIKQRLTQEALAAKAHLSPSPVRRLEQGQGVQLSAFLALVSALGLNDQLLGLFQEELVGPREIANGDEGRSPPRQRVSRANPPDEIRSAS